MNPPNKPPTKFPDHAIKTSDARIFVAFCDMVKFQDWVNMSHSLKDLEYSITHLYKTLFNMKEVNGYYMKLIGDGAMLVKEMAPGSNQKLFSRYMLEMVDLYENINELILKSPWPRPAGFRIRIASGYVLRIGYRFCGIDCDSQHDYVGYCVNLAHRLLDVEPLKYPIICHESIREIIGTGQSKTDGFEFEAIQFDEAHENGVNSEDLKNLWNFKIVKKEG